MGSLITALASFVDIKQQGGHWYVRIDDIDPPRAAPGAQQHILQSLSTHGLHSDRPIDYQSSHSERYQASLNHLSDQLFYCRCSRKSLRNAPVYPGNCVDHHQPRDDAAVRIHLSEHGNISQSEVKFTDRLVGPHQIEMASKIGDFIVKRRDTLWAYNFATAVDDGLDVTHVTRGRDLFDTTAPQIFLMQQLGLEIPTYAHVPLLHFADGSKLSKQTHAPALDNTKPAENLRYALFQLGQLGQNPPTTEIWSVEQWIQWGVQNWDMNKIPKQLQPFQ